MTHHPRRTRVLPVLSPVAAAVSTLLIGALPAHAQEQITVTGVRHAIETSLTTKRDSDSIVEAVTAEDIGKLPDVSIAESLARLPGLAAQRVDGRAQIISIRGMGGKYSGTLLNGREMVSTSDNRDAEYDQFPSELLGSALVYKTTDAALIGQGISGTVDMRTVRPLDFRGRQLAFNLRGEVNSNGQLAQGGASDKGGDDEVRYAVSHGVFQIAGDRALLMAERFATRESLDVVSTRHRLKEVDEQLASYSGDLEDPKRAELIEEEQWLGALLELIGDPPPPTVRELTRFLSKQSEPHVVHEHGEGAEAAKGSGDSE